MATITYCRQEEAPEDGQAADGIREKQAGDKGLHAAIRRYLEVLHTIKGIRSVKTGGKQCAGRLQVMGREQKDSRPAAVREIELPDGRICCYTVSRDRKAAARQLAWIEEVNGDSFRESSKGHIWMEEGLAQQLGRRQPELTREEVSGLINAVRQGALRNTGRRESLLVIAPEDEESFYMTWYIDVLASCMEDLNHFTVCTRQPCYYEWLMETAMEREGLLIRCVSEIPKDYPLGRRLLILNFRRDCRVRRSLLAQDTVLVTVSEAGFVKFLDTAVKNSYNIYS